MRFKSYPYKQDIYMYCDIDIIIVKSLHNLTEKMLMDHIYVCTEGFLKEENYSADFPSDFIMDDTSAGLSSGKFAIYGKDIRDSLFTIINSLCKYESAYYTLEQPFFNHAILLRLPDTVSLDVEVLNSPFVSFNGDEYKKGITVMFDCAGEPGNGKLHYDFMIDVLCLLDCGFF